MILSRNAFKFEARAYNAYCTFFKFEARAESLAQLTVKNRKLATSATVPDFNYVWIFVW